MPGVSWAMRCRSFLLGSLVALSQAAPASAAPSGFTEEAYTSAALSPATGAAWAPDGSGRLFVLRKNGLIQVVRTLQGKLQTADDGHTLEVSTFATEPSVYTNSESGLLGLVFDSNYVVNRRLYVFVSVSGSEQQVVHYTDVDGGSEAAGIGAQRTVILSRLPNRGESRVGGGLAIGADGKLYFAIGDLGNGSGVNADLTNLASKVGRANLDGTPVNDNPFNDGVGPNNEYIWARGLRNPFGLLRQPGSGAVWATVPGSLYEQVFLVARRAHAGFADYENNQPSSNDYIAPKIVYRTNDVDTRTVVSAQRTAGVTTVTTSLDHGFRQGQLVTLAGFSNATFHGDVYVSSTPSAQSFTVSQAGTNASATGGTAKTQNLGGAITRGTFYDGTAFPSEYRGNFFFGDYNSGNLIRAQLSDENEVTRVDVWSSGYAGNVQVTTGPDGALYALGSTSGSLRRISRTTTTPALVLSDTHVYVAEGGQAAFTVALAAAPTSPVTVQVAREEGDTALTLESGASFTFTHADWQRPRTVLLGAAPDADATSEAAVFTVSGAGLTTERVWARTIDDNSPELIVSADALSVPEGESAAFTVALSARPSSNISVSLTRVSGDTDLTITSPAQLTFSVSNWSTPQTVSVAAAADEDHVAGRARIVVAAPARARVLELVEVDDTPPPEPDAGPEDAGADGDAGLVDAGAQDAGPVDPSVDGGESAGDAGPIDAEVPGTDAPGDAGEPAQSPYDASTGDDDEADDIGDERSGGCGCAVNGRTASGSALWLVLGAWLVSRRRRRDAAR